MTFTPERGRHEKVKMTDSMYVGVCIGRVEAAREDMFNEIGFLVSVDNVIAAAQCGILVYVCSCITQCSSRVRHAEVWTYNKRLLVTQLSFIFNVRT